MKYSTIGEFSNVRTRKSGGGIREKLGLLLFATLFLNTFVLRAQQSNTAPDSNQSNQVLLQRIDQLEARLKEVEATLAKAQPAAPGATPVEAAPPPQAEPAPTAEHAESMDLNKTMLRIRGFSDVNLGFTTQSGKTTSFSLGQVDLFVTSDVSEKFKFLSEIVFEAGQDNTFGVDLERLLLTYSWNDYFNLSAGRYHTSIGYYNTAYHHSTWLQTATGRPFLFAFEDGGGILPIHNVGASLFGRIPSGRLGLHYVAEVGNGRSAHLGSEFVQNTVDENNGKAVNFEVFARPQAVPGLQTGFSVYHDHLTPLASPSVGETILAAHAVYTGLSFEWLNEALVIRHSPQGTPRVFHVPGFYTQVSRRFGSYRPYFRYQYVNSAQNEPIFFTNVGLRHGPSAGLRYDVSEFVALKLQYDYTLLRGNQSFHTVALQTGFTF